MCNIIRHCDFLIPFPIGDILLKLWYEMVNTGKKVDGQDESGDTAMEGAEAA